LLRFPSANDVFVHCSNKAAVKGVIKLCFPAFASTSNCASLTRQIVPQAREDFDSSAVQHCLRHSTFTAVKILIIFSRQNKACPQTNQTFHPLPEQIKIFEIINPKLIQKSTKSKLPSPCTIRICYVPSTLGPN
jgi:hypothetical protein